MSMPSKLIQLCRVAGLCLLINVGSASAAESPRFPVQGSETRIQGELVSADFIHRTGQFRSADGKLQDFQLPPYALFTYRGSPADLRDVPLGAKLEFALVPDAEQRLTQLVAVKDDQPADESQRAKFIEFTKARGLAGWIDQVEGKRLTVTFFGDPEFVGQLLEDFPVQKDARVCVANDELRTWNPPVDGERGHVYEKREVSSAGLGCSGRQIVIGVPNLLEGFRAGRVVRIFAPSWKAKDQPYGESLMNYGFGRLQTSSLEENPAKEYPGQFPFRTDFGNTDLAWYQLKSGESPPPYSEHRVLGELLEVDAKNRTGKFRDELSQEVVTFTLLPEAPAIKAPHPLPKTGTARYLGREVPLDQLPLGQRYRFYLYQDDQGLFTRVCFLSDEYSHLTQQAISYRVDQLNLDHGSIDVAYQIPEVKDYNGDMQQPSDVGHRRLLVTPETRYWQGDQQTKPTDLKQGDLLRANLSSEQPDSPSHCTDIWIGEETFERLAKGK